MNGWPTYVTHADARCFHCGGALVRHALSGHADGYGEYRAVCPVDERSTWYDCVELLPCETESEAKR